MRDTLTEILLGLRLEGVEYGRCLLRAPWAVATSAQPAALFLFVAQGGCWLRTETTEWTYLNAGDAVLFPRGASYVMASSQDVPAVDKATLARRPVSENIYLVNSESKESDIEPDVLFCGAMHFNLDPLHPLIAIMPDMMRASDLAKRDPSVPALLEAMEREISLDRIGACGILARLADVLAATIIRAWIECACSDSSGWIAAVRCPQLGKVLVAIHTQPERDWSVAELADVMGASRSSFNDKFSRMLGVTPAKYVARVKMFQARQWIARDNMRIAVAANRLGYDSEASFSRAFKRIIGHPPSEAREAETV
ncbi:AraC family transcriptional regulator [Halomonas sp. ATBC28]|jgi:AraC-like DNA-binding protein|uniref:RCS-specific HTH-type transcriptional activator RclR n=1 Tax=Vreelandella titanicae TaxID=664683 RepID=A0A1G8H770_9GAMM|nr:MULTISPECIES: AraC family transcriptional regulator [Halomonas]UEQ05402.1 AraC family transcriptional regulator [Halomonas profundus]KIN16131.1 AraC family transcriptional regulator [Halomonas sp. KHS3]MCD1586253.1 AraC family transcriptional regulator [Halomonas sp. IOP_14]MCE7516758.1 AraC family transcriptional regulator [Halomonas titanicae]PKH63583.1 AraC family transcriptional regulator [Halomonas sp. Choline-3u-9]|tara:strand:+ start:290 stop:1222 length:933 start_codon:yes stop_codon:yes gene_type:complete